MFYLNYGGYDPNYSGITAPSYPIGCDCGGCSRCDPSAPDQLHTEEEQPVTTVSEFVGPPRPWPWQQCDEPPF